MNDLISRPFAWQLGTPTAQFENPWMRVDTIPAIDPGGKEASYGLVHFKNVAVGILPYVQGDVWLVGQSRVSTQSYSWEMPAGGCPKGEPHIDAAHRELAEETGLRAAKMEPILDMQLSNSITDERGVVYLATELTPGENALESSEDITVARVSLDTALDAITSGQITQAFTITALLKLDQMRAAGLLDGR